jgi:hypothetical protein
MGAVAIALTAANGYAQTAVSSTFNHFVTGFPLTGTHLSVGCASCHVNGRFASTPKRCFGCHNTITAPGEPQSHPRTTTLCEGCHQTTTWRDYRFIDHAQAIGPCATCHNNKFALGKSNTHIATAAPCETCHFNTVTFSGAKVPADPPGTAASVAAARPAGGAGVPATTTRAIQPRAGAVKPTAASTAAVAPAAGKARSHPDASNGCASCHNGVTAAGKRANHVATIAPCESCHKSTVTFAGARMNHAELVTNCARCHGGAGATAKPPNHIATNAPCETCHKSTVTFAGARVDHSNLTGVCSSCHNGATAEGKPPQHFLTTLPCETCHRTATWTSATYRHTSPSYASHAPGLGCSSCHVSNAQTVAWRFPAFRPSCASCHFDKYRPLSHLKFRRPATIYYTVAELRDCAGACHTFADSTQRVVLTRGFGAHRAIGGGW